MRHGLNARQGKFAVEFLKDMDAKAAAIRAGYSPKTAEAQGPALLSHPGVKAALAETRQRVQTSVEAKVPRVVEELVAVAFSDIGEVLDFSGEVVRLRDPATISERARRAIASVKVKRYVEKDGDEKRVVETVEFKLWSKNDALEKLGRYLGMFVEKHEITGKDGQPLLTLEAVRRILHAAA